MDLWYCVCMHAKLLQSCPTLCGPVDCSPPDSSVHGILQARILEWVAMPFSRGSSPPRDWTHISYVSLHWQAGSLPPLPLGKPRGYYTSAVTQTEKDKTCIISLIYGGLKNKTNEQIQQNRNRFIDAEYELWLPEAWDGMREILRGTHFQL